MGFLDSVDKSNQQCCPSSPAVMQRLAESIALTESPEATDTADTGRLVIVKRLEILQNTTQRKQGATEEAC